MNKNLFHLILAIACISLLASCTSAPKHLAKAIAKDKPYVAEQTRMLWPCVTTAADTTYITDTIIDVVETQCPDVEYTTPEGKVIYLPGKTVTIQGATVFKERTVTVKVKDSAEIFLIQNNMEVAASMYKENLSKKDKSINDLTKKVNRKSKAVKWLLIALAALATPYIIRIIKLLK